MKIAIASDHGGYSLKELVKEACLGLGHEVKDLGCHSEDACDYPLFGKKAVELVASGAVDRGILICGTGIGMSIVANRYHGIRAALCHESYTAAMSRRHNDANVLCMGARVIGPGIATEMVKVWLNTPFEGGRHRRRLELIDRGE